MTTDERYAVVSALIDREPVDPDELAVLLEEDDGRRMLVDFVRLRALAALERDGEDDGQPVAVDATKHMSASWLLRLVAAVLLPLVLGLGGGYWWRVREQGRPPTPTRVLQFVPGVDWK